MKRRAARRSASRRRDGEGTTLRKPVRAMASHGWLTPALAAGFLVVCAMQARAQGQPHVGYVYPSGGQRGSSFEVTIGGQHLGGALSVWFSDEGVRGRVVSYTPAMGRKAAGELRRKLIGLLRQRRRRGGEARGNAGAEAEPVAFRGIDLSAMSSEDLQALYRKYFDRKKQPNPQIAEEITLRVEVDPDAVAGQRELRLFTRAGISDPLRFQVRPWPEVIEQEPNESVPQRIERPAGPILINGCILPGDVDLFQFEARKGEDLVARVQARALVPYLADAVPGWFQAVLTLRDEEGREIAYADDFRFDPDPVLHFVVPDSGTYVLEIRDAIYRGREDFVYRLSLGELPFVTGVFPLGGRAGTRPRIELDGWNLQVSGLSLGGESLSRGRHWVAVRSQRWVSNRLPFDVDTLPECFEEEPDDSVREGQWLGTPTIVNGRIGAPGDVDVFLIEGKADQTIVAEIEARRLASPLDSVLWLTDAHGRELARNDDHEDRAAGLVTHQADSYLLATLPENGRYALHLADIQHHGGEAYAYRLRVGAPRPDFELRVVPSGINVRPGGTVPLTVHALRRDGFDGEIKLDLADAPRGFVLSGGWVPAGQDRVTVTLTAPIRPLDEPVRLSLVGQAGIDGHDVRREAVAAEDMMQAFLNRHLVAASALIVAPVPSARSQLPLEILARGPVNIPAGGTAQVRIRGPRKTPPGKITLELMEGPPGLAIEKVSPIRRMTTLTFKAEAELAETGWEGNVIVGVFLERTRAARDTKGRSRTRRIALGTLPAIPCEIAKH